MADPTEPDGAGGGTLPVIARLEHHKDAKAKKVVIRGLNSSGTTWSNVTVEQDSGNPFYYAISVTPSPSAQFAILPYGLAAGTFAAAIFSKHKISGASLTASYADLSPAISVNAVNEFQMFNSCDQAILVSLNNGTTDHFELDPYESATVSFIGGALFLAPSVDGSTPYTFQLKAKHAGVTPTAGSLRVTVNRQSV